VRQEVRPLFRFGAEEFATGLSGGTITVPMDRIPPNKQTQIRNILVGWGINATSELVEQYYTAEQFGAPDAVTEFLSRYRR
jgi:hypothetical protein